MNLLQDYLDLRKDVVRQLNSLYLQLEEIHKCSPELMENAEKALIFRTTHNAIVLPMISKIARANSLQFVSTNTDPHFMSDYLLQLRNRKKFTGTSIFRLIVRCILCYISE